MNIEVCNNTYTYIWDKHIPLGAWYGQDENGWWFCTAHGRSKDNSLTLFRYNGRHWTKALENSRTTHIIWAWAEKNGLWWTKCHWFIEEDKHTSLVARQYNHNQRYINMMKHDRKHKKSGSGVRLDKENFYADKTIIDYECSSRPLHDFRRVYN